MIRAFLITVAIALCVAAGGVVTTAAHARVSSPAPNPEGSDCSWEEHGVTMGGYRCLCARLTGPNGPEVLCRWYRVDKLPRQPKKKPKLKAPAARYGISTGVLFHA